jgi:hypothetical protein
MRRLLNAAIVVALVAVYTALFVGFVRWYTNGTHDCSNCDPE